MMGRIRNNWYKEQNIAYNVGWEEALKCQDS